MQYFYELSVLFIHSFIYFFHFFLSPFAAVDYRSGKGALFTHPYLA